LPYRVRKYGLVLQTKLRGLSACHSSEPCKNGWTNRVVVWVEDLGGPKESCIRWAPDPPVGRGNFEGGKGGPLVQGLPAVSCAKMTEPIQMPFGLRTRVGPRKHVLGGMRTIAT